jgi:putative transcriptional regulator
VKNNLEILRKTNNISQEQLAAELNVSRQTVSSLENGRYNPSVILALKIAKYFNCKVEDVFLLE